MLSFEASPTRQRFLSRFKADGEGYLYCRSPKALPVRISAKDHHFMVNAFDTDWLRFPMIVLAALGIAALILSLSFLYGPSLEGAVLLCAVVAFIAAWWADIWDEPNRALFQRATDMEKTRNLSWITRSAANTTWKSMLIPLYFLFSALVRDFKPYSSDFWDQFFLVILIVVSGIIGLTAIKKIRLSRARSLPYLNQLH